MTFSREHVTFIRMSKGHALLKSGREIYPLLSNSLAQISRVALTHLFSKCQVNRKFVDAFTDIIFARERLRRFPMPRATFDIHFFLTFHIALIMICLESTNIYVLAAFLENEC